MSLCEIDQIDWPTQPDRKLFDELDSDLGVERRGRSDGKIQITIIAAMACRERAEEDCNDDRGMACQDPFNRSRNRCASLRGRVADAMGVAHISSVTTNGLQAQGKEGEVAGVVSLLAERAPSEGWRRSGQVPFLLAEQRRGWSLMIFCARATRGRGLPSLDARSGRSISPHPQRKNKRAWREHVYRSMRAVKDNLGHSLKEKH